MSTRKARVLHPVGADGAAIDASFTVKRTEDGFAIDYASRGGTKGTPSARNSEYHIGLTVVLERLKKLDAIVIDLLLNSAEARKHSIAERRLDLSSVGRLPIDLARVANIDALRRQISEAQRNVVAAPGRNSKHGNRVRAIRILVQIPATDEGYVGEEELAAAIVREDLSTTFDYDQLRTRAKALLARGKVEKPVGSLKPSTLDVGPTKRFARSPDVVAYVLQRANGQCELCGSSTFATDLGDTYLEVHHVVQLSVGGPDTVDNAVAVCANCHRELHYGVNRHALTARLAERISELVVHQTPSN